MTLRTLLPVLALIATTAPSLDAQQKIPELHTTAFSGEHVDLPAALAGHTTVLILSFSQGSRDSVTAWFRQLAADYKTSPTVLYYNLPVLAGAPGFLRGSITKKIKETVPAPAQPRFLPVYDHEDEWKAAAGYAKHDPDGTLYLVVVDSTGTILFHFATASAPTPQTYGEIRKAVVSGQ
jgi:hypothetical protein